MTSIQARAVTEQELLIEQGIDLLGKLLDDFYGVTDEFTTVLSTAIATHTELIDEQKTN